MSGIDRVRLRQLAAAARLTLLGVTTAEPFHELAALLEAHIRAGHMAGLDWFTEERARFSADPRNLHPTARSIVSVGLPYWQPDIVPPDDGVPRGRIARYAWGRDYHATLKARMRDLHARLEQELGRPLEARFLVDTARIVDRAAAARSGLGWYGKNTMILVPGHGSWVMLGELVLDIDLEPSPPLRPKCGRCTRCLDACPTGALIDAYRLHTPHCISYLTIELRGAIPRHLRPLMGNWVFGCDICQELCPYTGAAAPSADPDVRPERIEHAFPALHWLLRMSEEEFRAVYRGRAVLRAKRRGLARNAAVALGNVGTRADLALLEEVATAHDLPLVRGHAAWAIARIAGADSLPALRAILDREQDPAVREELRAILDDPPPPRCQCAA
ncbi:MAG: tRNA epoxyqueuosine(34) reductase QueG [Sphaerobacter sp.]|nr:tRNA epoxyqueuosine(34) reductase QueG [Sphaerobacter sp.]